MSLPCCYTSETNPDGCRNRRYRASPMCQHHLFEMIRDAIYDDMMPPDALASLRSDMVPALLAGLRQSAELDDQAIAESVAARQHEPVVYYVALTRSRIKIGTTRNLPARLAAMRSGMEDLLAVEPGDRDVEKLRHRQFEDHLLDCASEEFYDCTSLRAWIRATRARHLDLLVLAEG